MPFLIFVNRYKCRTNRSHHSVSYALQTLWPLKNGLLYNRSLCLFFFRLNLLSGQNPRTRTIPHVSNTLQTQLVSHSVEFLNIVNAMGSWSVDGFRNRSVNIFLNRGLHFYMLLRSQVICRNKPFRNFLPRMLFQPLLIQRMVHLMLPQPIS